jgi:nucleotide-binding universal stress UspA family protein
MKILVPIDFSAATGTLLAALSRLAGSASVERVWLLHVAEPNPEFVGYEAGTPVVRDQVAAQQRHSHRELQAMAENLRAEGHDATALLVQGPTAEKILSEAERLKADLILMATHGHGAMYDLLVGSVSQAVLRASRIPLLLVPVRGD